MGLLLFLVYLTAFLLRPTELFPAFARYHLMDVLAALAIGGALWGLLRGRRPALRGPQIYVVLAFMLWAALSVFITLGWLRGAIHAFEYLAISLFLFLLALLNVDSLRRMKITAACLVALATILALQGIVAVNLGLFRERFILYKMAYLSEDETESDEPPSDEEMTMDVGDRGPRIRALGILADPNDLAQALVSLLPFAFVFRRRDEPLGNFFRSWLPAAIIVYGIYLTRSRGGLLALAALVFLALQRRLGMLLSVALGSLGALGLLSYAMFAPGISQLDESAADRIYAWHAALQMVRASPVWGVGFGNFTDIHELLAHNSFVHCAAELGLVGYFLWLSVIVITIGDSLALGWTLDAEDPFDAEMSTMLRAVRLGLAGFLVAGFFLSRAYSFMLFMLVGLSASLVNLAEWEGRPVPRFHPLGWLTGTLAVEVVTMTIVYLAVRMAS
jgi:hypothetical protein